MHRTYLLTNQMLSIPSGHTFSRVCVVCVICVCEAEQPNMSAVMIFPEPYLPHSFSPLRLLFSPCLPHSHSVRWSANYYANDWNRYQMRFAFFIFHTLLCRLVPGHTCVCVCLWGKTRDGGGGGWLQGSSGRLQNGVRWIKPLCGEKTAPANFLAHEKSHFIEGVGHKFGFIAEAPATQIGHRGEMRWRASLRSRLHVFPESSPQPFHRDGFMCH